MKCYSVRPPLIYCLFVVLEQALHLKICILHLQVGEGLPLALVTPENFYLTQNVFSLGIFYLFYTLPILNFVYLEPLICLFVLPRTI
jgi:hypothetical protein